MPTPEEHDAAEVVARFLAERRSGRRPSIDDVVSRCPGVTDPAAARSAALRSLAQRGQADAADPGDADALDLPRIDGYDIIDRVGRGGMGVVYEAYQHATGRRVAVKFLAESDLASDTLRRRFEREVELVARLSHPAIVSVLDSGIHRGRYFFVMEFVDGTPLHLALAAGECPLPEALRLVAEVADAVDYAHQRGVLHRDLKPSNILVDAHGRPHLLDFGLAKAIDPAARRADPGAPTLSEPGQFLGTPGYMPPEQWDGDQDKLSVRSDVYALGAVAFELVTGKLPVDVSGTILQAAQRVRHAEPRAPSSLRRAVGRDLDAVLLKALDKEPARRYRSAADFAADLRRYLAHEPVDARPSSTWVHLRRWHRRNRLPANLAAGALAAVLVVTVVAFVRILAARDLARLEKADSDAATDMMIEGIKSMNAYEGSTDQKIAQLMANLSVQLNAGKPRDPARRASLHAVVGSYYWPRFQVDLAVAHLAEAARLEREELGADPARLWIILSELGAAHFQDARYDDAARCYDEALRHAEAAFGPRSEEAARVLIRIASNDRRLGRIRQALATNERILSIRREILPAGDPIIANSLNQVAIGLADVGEYDRAVPLATEALLIVRQDEARRGSPTNEVAQVTLNVGIFLLDSGFIPEAEALLLESDRRRIERWGLIHGDVGTSKYQLARARRAAGDLDAARRLCQQSLDIRRAVHHGENNPAYADSAQLMGRILLEAGSPAEAEPWLRHAHRTRLDGEQGATHVLTAEAASLLAACELALGRPDAALELARPALDVLAGTIGEHHWRTRDAMRRLIAVHDALGQESAAESLRARLDAAEAQAARHRPLLPPVLRLPDSTP